jgi:hypothetical protein
MRLNIVKQIRMPSANDCRAAADREKPTAEQIRGDRLSPGVTKGSISPPAEALPRIRCFAGLDAWSERDV